MTNYRSRIYDCEVFHSRHAPARHSFKYRYFTFCLDLDEVDSLAKKFSFFGTQVFKPFRFVPKDLIFGNNAPTAAAVKAAVIGFASKMGARSPIERIEFVGHVRTLGYAYNPAAFYFGYGKDDRLLFGIVEVTNTFHEKKAYFIPADSSGRDGLSDIQQKLFYVSPFLDLDTHFEFSLKQPAETLSLQIDSRKPGTSVVLHATLKGIARPFTAQRLLLNFFRFPLITLGVMAKIHIQAAKLYLKRVPYIKKLDHPNLQKGGLP